MADRGWQIGKSLSRCMYHILQNEVDCDVRFVFPSSDPPTHFPAHRLLLKSRSPVFEAMFSGGYVEDTQDVEIVDIEPDVFKEMITFIYTDNVELSENNVIPLLLAAKKYILDGLQEECSRFLQKQIQEETSCTIFNQSLVFGDKVLAEKCLEFIAPNVSSILQGDTFLSLSHEALLYILKSDQLIVEEKYLFRRCIEWARHQIFQSQKIATDAKMREILGACCQQIRFSEMEPTDFVAEIGRHSQVLSVEEKNRMYCYMLTKSEEDKALISLSGFNIRPRKKIHSIVRFNPNTINFGWNKNGAAEYLAFNITKPILFCGIYVYTGQPKTKHVVIVQLWQLVGRCSSSPKLLCENETTILSEHNKNLHQVMVKGQHLTTDQTYVIIVTTEGPPTFYGSVRNNPITAEGVSFSFQNINAKIFQTGDWKDVQFISALQQGQIPQILFATDP